MIDNIIKNIFDSHSHYNDEKFDDNRDEILKSLPSKGIDKIINVSASEKDAYDCVNLAEKYDYIFASVGVHPYEIENLSQDYIYNLESLSKNKKVVAIGEIGLDYYNNNIDKDLQKKIFEDQLALASELKMPVIIHAREADQDIINILKKFKLSGVIHCFSSDKEIAKILIQMGYYISFTGVITFKNNRKQLESLSAVPIERLLIETDCPYMAPEPHRGKICDSSMLYYIIKKIENIKNIPAQEIADITNKNAKELFNIK
ncbi:MAG: TatD family hydrolase [Oscillospiraceae bacterium]|nr:TatD family hydrolase [Oscillospiraceae bacterium]